jgi:hypothetical protein
MHYRFCQEVHVGESPVSAPPGDRVTDRVMRGETPLQALARQPRSEGGGALRSIERFPYYTAFPFAWRRACHAEDLPAGGVRPLRYLGRDPSRGAARTASRT